MLIANEGQVHKLDENGRVLQIKPLLADEPYSTVFSYTKKRLGIDELEFFPRLFSCAQMLPELIESRISGVLASRGHVYDYMAIAWAAQQLGLDVEYANGRQFGEFQFIDTITPQGRITPRDKQGLVLIGDKNHAWFQRYKRAYNS